MSKKFNLPTATTPAKTPVNLASVSKPIKDFYTTENQGIILTSGTALQEIFTKSGPLAKSNEFQVHYWALNFRYKAPDDSILDICIPTCYFNYPQEVSGAAIDFDLKDVQEMSKKVEPLHNAKVNELLALDIQAALSFTFGVPFEAMASNYNSIHRHPGGSSSQSFSGTDLTKNATEPGVVFPLQSASNDTPNFAGIMAIDSGKCNTAHYEYRTANGTLGTDLEYVEGRCFAVTVHPTKQPSVVEKLFGIHAESATTTRYKRCKSNEVLTSVIDLAEQLYLTDQFEPDVRIINPDNLTQKTVTYSYGNSATKYIEKSDKELTAMRLWELNAHYKVCFLEANKKTTTEWVAIEATLIQKIKDLQKIISEKKANEPKLNKVTPTSELLKKTNEELLAHLNTLNDKLYTGISMAPYTIDFFTSKLTGAVSKTAIIEEIDELESWMDISDLDDEDDDHNIPTIAIMRDELIQFGADKAKIILASDQQIKQWYEATCNLG